MKEYLDKAISYSDYKELIDDLLEKGLTTGPVQTEGRVAFTRLNRTRMRRLEKTIELVENERATVNGTARKMIWLILTEGWCGDAAQNIPVIEKIAAESDIVTRYILRDEHPELIDRFLTDGVRAIPKLIALDAATLEVLGSWGSRPAAAQELFFKLKSEGTEKDIILEKMQRWYNADRGRSLRTELISLIDRWSREQASCAAG
jgi:hypothetical protein